MKFARGFGSARAIFCGIALMLVALAAASSAYARSVDSVTLTLSVSAAPAATPQSAAPGELAPAGFVISNQGSRLAIDGELDFTAPLLNTSVIRGWWIAVERRTGSGSWIPVAGHSSAVAGHTFSAAPPATSGMTTTATPKPSLGVAYPATGDRVLGTQIIGLARANWDFDSEIVLSAADTASLMSAANSGDVRLRWRLESRNTGLFGIVTSGSRSNTAPFTLMLRSQSSSATNVLVSVTGDGRTQSFTPANTPGLSSLPIGASVTVNSTARIPEVAPRAAGESDDEYLDRLEAAKNQNVSLNASTSFTASGSALAYWWWPWDTDSPFDLGPNRSVTAPAAATSAAVQVPIIRLTKVGPASVNSGSSAEYTLSATNSGNATGNVAVTDAVDGYVPQSVPGFGSIAAGAAVDRPYTHAVSITTPSGTLSNTASATWIDSAANSYGPVSDSFTIDVIGDEDPPPPPTLTETPASFSNSAESAFSFIGEPGGTFECSVDGSAAAPCTSPFSTGTLPDGQHQFSVSQRDAAGNLGSANTFVWTIDTIAPVAPTIDQAPTGEVGSADAQIEFTGEALATAECRVGAGEWASCESPASLTALPEGAVQFEVRLTDQAGNVGAPVQASWIVDTTAPATPQLTATPPTISDSSDGSFEFTIESGATAQCSFDGAAFAACESPATYSGFEAGAHTFAVRAVDTAGNVGGAGTYSWTIEFENNQCRPEVTESAPLEIPDEAGMEEPEGGQ